MRDIYANHIQIHRTMDNHLTSHDRHTAHRITIHVHESATDRYTAKRDRLWVLSASVCRECVRWVGPVLLALAAALYIAHARRQAPLHGAQLLCHATRH